MQAKRKLEEYLNNSLVNKLIESKVPTACKNKPCILGIDEAGRGPVLGPMSYAVAYYPQADEQVLSQMEFADSKSLTEAKREKLFEALQTTKQEGYQNLGYMIKIISPNAISNAMLRRQKYNLNALSHDTAIELIRSVEARGISIAHVYIDTVGPPIKYKEKLSKIFSGINFTVTEKADSKYPIVSAASICAKVSRDRIVNGWKYVEGGSLQLDSFELGSGYPADPGTKKFLEKSLDPVFGYPTLARFSWSTITKILDQSGCKCDWNEPEDDEMDQKALSYQQKNMKSWFKKKPPTPKSKSVNKAAVAPKPSNEQNPKFFIDRNLDKLINIDF